jgi:alpha-L-fucosidase
LEYDLSQLSSSGPHNITTNATFNYIVQVCDAIQTGLPVVCNSKFNSTSPATAYAYSKNSCYQLGQLEHDFAYPLDPINSSVGIRLAYTNGGNKLSFALTINDQNY